MNQVTKRSSQEAEGPPLVSSRLGVLGRATALALLGMGLIYLFQFLRLPVLLEAPLEGEGTR